MCKRRRERKKEGIIHPAEKQRLIYLKWIERVKKNTVLLFDGNLE